MIQTVTDKNHCVFGFEYQQLSKEEIKKKSEEYVDKAKPFITAALISASAYLIEKASIIVKAALKIFVSTNYPEQAPMYHPVIDHSVDVSAKGALLVTTASAGKSSEKSARLSKKCLNSPSGDCSLSILSALSRKLGF